MNGYPRSLYLVKKQEDSPTTRAKSPEVPVAPVAVAVAPPQPLPRTTVSRPVTVGTLREAKAAAAAPAHRAHYTERARDKEAAVVPVQEKQRRKTVAFGHTVNVSQTVERTKDPRNEPRPSLAPRTHAPAVMASTLARTTGLGATATRTTGGTTAARNSPHLLGGGAATAAATPAGDENRTEGGGEEKELRAALQKESTRTARLESRVVDLEKREREARAEALDFKKQIANLVQLVSSLTRRMLELEEDVPGKKTRRSGGERGGGGGRRGRSSEDEDVRRPFRRLNLSDEDERENRRRGGGGARHTTTPHRLLSDEETRRALERQLSSNPVLLRQVQDAIAEEAYERDYGAGGAERRAPTTNTRRPAAFFDEYDEPRATAERARRGGVGAERWMDDTRGGGGRAGALSPPGGRGGGGGTRKRADITPSRRRVTERVTMERVHHFDDTDESDDARFESDEPAYTTQYNEEIVEDFESVAQADGRFGQHARMNRGGHRGGAPIIQELCDSEDSLDRKRRELRERKQVTNFLTMPGDECFKCHASDHLASNCPKSDGANAVLENLQLTLEETRLTVEMMKFANSEKEEENMVKLQEQYRMKEEIGRIDEVYKMLSGGKSAVRFVRLAEQARQPVYGSSHAAGADLHASEAVVVPARGKALISTGLSLELPQGVLGYIAPCPGHDPNLAIHLCGTLIDRDYIGELKVIAVNISNVDAVVSAEDVFGQLFLFEEPILYTSSHAAGTDLHASEAVVVPARGKALISTGLSLELPQGDLGCILPCSCLASNEAIHTCATVVEADQRCEVVVTLLNTSDVDYEVQEKDWIAQFVCEKISQVNYCEVSSLDETQRGAGGFGSNDL